jgi:hypothetical protein
MSLETEITPRHPFEAARTILTASGRVKIPCSMFIHLIQLNFCWPRRPACATAGRLSKQWSDFGAAPFRTASNDRFGNGAERGSGQARLCGEDRALSFASSRVSCPRRRLC